MQSCPLVGSTRGLGWVGLGRVGSRFCSFRLVGLGLVEYDKITIFLMINYTAYNYIPVEFLGSSEKV